MTTDTTTLRALAQETITELERAIGCGYFTDPPHVCTPYLRLQLAQVQGWVAELLDDGKVAALRAAQPGPMLTRHDAAAKAITQAHGALIQRAEVKHGQ